MPDARTLDLITELARDSGRRSVTARELALHLGAEDLLLLFPDRIHAVHVPALGFPQTLFEGRLWKRFIAEVIQKSFAVAELNYPTAAKKRTARGWGAADTSVLVLFDGEPDLARVEAFCRLLPVVAVNFEGERSAMVSAARVKLAQANAQQARELAESLDAVRRQLQETILLREQDIAERQRIEVELERSNTDLQQFAYVAAHDLQAPVRMIVSYSQLLTQRYGTALDDDARKFLDFIVEGGFRMRELIQGLLSYAQVGEPAAAEPTDAGQALAIALTDLSSQIEETEAVVTHNMMPTVMAEQTLLIRLFENLLSNALKYRGESPPRIQICAQLRDSHCVISVKDNGIGIASQDRESVFGLFKRLHGSNYPGAGLGLATCRRIVERLGGRIWVESQAGAGSTFSFTLPLAASVNAPALG